MKPITPDLEAVLQRVLLPGEDPALSALRELNNIRSGDNATIYEHPTNPGLVVRAVDGNDDGWLAYAESFHRSGVKSPYAPVMHDLVHVSVYGNSRWFATVERLQPVEGEALEKAMQAAQRLMDAKEYGAFTAEDRKLLDAEQPGLIEFIRQLGANMIDAHDGNWLARGETLVVNDPAARMSPSAAKRMAAIYDVERRGRPALSVAPAP
jgi:hypothetical protein